MMDLVACISAGEKSWSHVARLINEGEWANIFVVTNEHGRKNFKAGKNIHFIAVDFDTPAFELIENIRKNLAGRIRGFEVALNIVSGNGKEHMSVLSALLKLGVGIRLMAVTKEGIKEL